MADIYPFKCESNTEQFEANFKNAFYNMWDKNHDLGNSIELQANEFLNEKRTLGEETPKIRVREDDSSENDMLTVSTDDSNDHNKLITLPESISPKQNKLMIKPKNQNLGNKRVDESSRIVFNSIFKEIENAINELLGLVFNPLKKDPKMKFSSLLLKKKIVGKSMLKSISKQTIKQILINPVYTPQYIEYLNIICILESSNSSYATDCLKMLSKTLLESFTLYFNDKNFIDKTFKNQNEVMRIVDYFSNKVNLN